MTLGEKATEVLQLIETADNLMKAEHLDWEDRYDMIFALRVQDPIRDLGWTFEYYDPDTTYEEDVKALVGYLTETMRPRLEAFLKAWTQDPIACSWQTVPVDIKPATR